VSYLFFTVSEDLETVVGKLSFTKPPKVIGELESAIEWLDGNQCDAVFIDYQDNNSPAEKLNKLMSKNYDIRRVYVGDSKSNLKKLKKHQTSSVAADAYLARPLDTLSIHNTIYDFEMCDYLVENGTQVGFLLSSLGEVSEIEHQEMQMDTVVRSTINDHSLREEDESFDREDSIHLSIQKKFDHVFNESEQDEKEKNEGGALEINFCAENPSNQEGAEGDLSISLDLGEGAEEAELIMGNDKNDFDESTDPTVLMSVEKNKTEDTDEDSGVGELSFGDIEPEDELDLVEGPAQELDDSSMTSEESESGLSFSFGSDDALDLSQEKPEASGMTNSAINEPFNLDDSLEFNSDGLEKVNNSENGIDLLSEDSTGGFEIERNDLASGVSKNFLLEAEQAEQAEQTEQTEQAEQTEQTEQAEQTEQTEQAEQVEENGAPKFDPMPEDIFTISGDSKKEFEESSDDNHSVDSASVIETEGSDFILPSEILGSGDVDVEEKESVDILLDSTRTETVTHIEDDPLLIEDGINRTPISKDYQIMSQYQEEEMLRHQEVLRQLREERDFLADKVNQLKSSSDFSQREHISLKSELEELRIENSILKKRHLNELSEAKEHMKLAEEKKIIYEQRAKNLQGEFERLSQKVKVDFNQVKRRERELESQLELVKMDSQAQVESRDRKILELKRKIDALEFNIENVSIRDQKSKVDKVKLEERLEKVMKTLRGSIEMLEDEEDVTVDLTGRFND